MGGKYVLELMKYSKYCTSGRYNLLVLMEGKVQVLFVKASCIEPAWWALTDGQGW